MIIRNFKYTSTQPQGRPSQAEVTINNNNLKLEEHLLVWAASLGANDKASSKSSLKLYIFGNFWSRLCRFLSLSHERSK